MEDNKDTLDLASLLADSTAEKPVKPSISTEQNTEKVSNSTSYTLPESNTGKEIVENALLSGKKSESGTEKTTKVTGQIAEEKVEADTESEKDTEDDVDTISLSGLNLDGIITDNEGSENNSEDGSRDTNDSGWITDNEEDEADNDSDSYIEVKQTLPARLDPDKLRSIKLSANQKITWNQAVDLLNQIQNQTTDHLVPIENEYGQIVAYERKLKITD